MTWPLLLALSCPIWSSVTASAGPPLVSHGIVRLSLPARVDETIGDARKRFAAEVTNGRLKDFDEERAQVVFKAPEKDDSAHRPGPMEDDVIAATLRSHIAGDAGLRTLGLKIRSDAGRVQFTGTPGNADELAKLIVLALNIDGVNGVRADLPPALRGKS